MFGQNPSEKFLQKHDGLFVDIVELFPTIQGEGPYAGERAVFVRLAGCHLKCFFCDTDFTSNRSTHAALAISERAKNASSGRLVVLTGGEPMRQNIVPLCFWLTAEPEAKHVQIETAGSFWPYEKLCQRDFESMLSSGRVSIVVSPKTAHVHPKLAAAATAWKYIVAADDPSDVYDGLPVASTQHRGERGDAYAPARPPVGTAPERVYVQPRDDQDPEKNRRNIERAAWLVQRYGYRLSLQQHKIIGVP